MGYHVEIYSVIMLRGTRSEIIYTIDRKMLSVLNITDANNGMITELHRDVRQ